MRVFLIGCLLFGVSLAIHLLIWKVRVPKRHIPTLLIVFFIVLILWTITSDVLSIPLWEFLHTALFFSSMSLCYVITYSAIEADSPTLSLIRFLAEAKDAGRSRDEITQFMALRPFVRARLLALARSGLIRQERSYYIAVGPGPLSFRLILGFRKLYGPISKGG
jgi:hypothetical protein